MQRSTWKPAAEARPLRRAAGARGGLVLAALLGGILSLLSCGSPTPPGTQNPATLWLSFGQTELDLILIDSEPPYY